MNQSLVIKTAGNPKGSLYKIFTFIGRQAYTFALRNQSIFEGIARTAAPFGGNVLNSRI